MLFYITLASVLTIIARSNGEVDHAIASILQNSGPHIPPLMPAISQQQLPYAKQDSLPTGPHPNQYDQQQQQEISQPHKPQPPMYPHDMLPTGMQPPYSPFQIPSLTLQGPVQDLQPQFPLMPALHPHMPPHMQAPVVTSTKVPCTCGVFLSGQFKKGSSEPPTGNAVLMQELTDSLPCSSLGEKQCTNKCLDILVKHLPNSPALVCGSMDRDCYKERAYLFVKNCDNKWYNTNLSAGREFCCKDSMPFKCPI